MTPYIIGIRFQKTGKLYHFDASNFPGAQPGDYAVVDTSRGRQLGEVTAVIQSPPPPPDGTWKPIQRLATPRDLALRQLWQRKEVEAVINCRAKAADFKLIGIKIVAAEFSFDGERLCFLFSSETEIKIDLKKLRTAMKRIYPRSRIEMRQVGPRDVAKYLGGMGACGLENRCCSRFLTDFSPISIKMAKEQGISLTPSEITGMCGRLRCCLVYEYDQYLEARKILPTRGKRVITPVGIGIVLDVIPIKMSILVELEKGNKQEFSIETVKPFDELEKIREKTKDPFDINIDRGSNKRMITSDDN